MMLKGSLQSLAGRRTRSAASAPNQAVSAPAMVPRSPSAAPGATPAASPSALRSSTLPGCRAPIVASRGSSPAPSWVCSAVNTLERVDTSVGRYRCHSRDGAIVDAVTEARDGKLIVRITADYSNVPGKAPKGPLQLHWGMFRASGSKWHHPKEAVPPDSALEAGGSGAMRTAMTWDARAGAWALRFEVPARLAPLHLAFALYQPELDKFDTPLRALHFCIPLGMSPGAPQVLGASVVSVTPGGDPRDASCAVNFAVFSRHATSVQLCLVRVKGPSAERNGVAPGVLQGQSVLEIMLDPLTHRTGDVWHICVHGLKDLETLCWAWRADGEILWENGKRFHPGFMLCDPYATRAVPVLLPEGAHKAAPRLPPAGAGGTGGEPVLLGSLSAFVQPAFDWQGFHQAVRGGQSRVKPLEEGVVVEVDVGSFTSGPEAEASVPPEHRGKYLGVLDRLDSLKAVGATTVLLSPVTLGAPSLSGRSPLSLLSPDTAYAVGGPLAAAEELKTLIRGLHQAGMEVLMQVEFCVTAEGGDASAGRLQGLRGLDHAVYYRDGLDAPVLNCGHPVVRKLVVDSLRHWAGEYRVEGFCVRSAENIAQDKFGSVLDNPPLAEELCGDPLLRNLKLVAAVGNPALLPRQAERGFPHWGLWLQLNDRFTSDLSNYLAASSRGQLSNVATRLTGSADLFSARWDAGLPGGLAVGRRPAFGLNAVAPLGDKALPEHLADVYFGGDQIRANAVARSLLVAQFVSAGQPLVAASTAAAPGMAALMAALSAVRRGYRPLLCPPSLTSPDRELTWHSPYGSGEPDWTGANPDPYANVLVLTVGGGPARPGHMIGLVINPQSEAYTVTLPRPPPGSVWRLLVDTARPVPTVQAPGSASLGTVLADQGSYGIGSYATILMDAVPQAGAASPPPSAGPSRAGTPPAGYGAAPSGRRP
ncbi:hypothetical protein HYH03_007608 [Edaphochlamys debaryana]|uniref:Uncharacterized protein n=1 Tax=Edaphochlamys debaryana TaxID=47281 RepID=A0A835Y1L5_9CHLO|nr:hypothetical protein HYH03_007608 [Edaphochlamys debaryana]|eukprot:KAG2494253.1 hypothetical protein HYH03_007608 [Edaphochlamys debaryana]